MKISFVTTIFNEEGTIIRLLDSVVRQSRLPDEVVIVDGGSTDQTVNIIKEFAKNNKEKLNLLFIEKKGNRSVGRNAGVEKSTGDIIVFSDAGCVLDSNFIKNIIKPFKESTVDVVAGYYRGVAETIFQQCLIPYVLVMPDRVNPDNFLPATRSMAIRRGVFEGMKGFDTKFSHNEDYVFAKKLQKAGKKISFAMDAIVTWIPRSGIRESFNMFYRFACGDAEAGIIRKKVIFLFLRYIIAFIFLCLALVLQSLFVVILLFLTFIFYLLWSVQKNYRYVKNARALYILPSLQLTADIAVIYGTVQGIIKRYGI